MTHVMKTLRERLPADAIIASGAGNFTVWAHRFYVFRRYRTQLAPLSGAMGYGLPAAIAAKLVHPERDVVCIAGDGDFLMSVPELATALQHDAPIVVLVVDNGMFGTIRMHQERHYPGRVSGTELVNPDFAALGRAFGGHGERVERSEDLPAALDRALAAGVPAVLHLPVDPEALTPRQTLSEIRAAASSGSVHEGREKPLSRKFFPFSRKAVPCAEEMRRRGGRFPVALAAATAVAFALSASAVGGLSADVVRGGGVELTHPGRLGEGSARSRERHRRPPDASRRRHRGCPRGGQRLPGVVVPGPGDGRRHRRDRMA